MVESLLKERRFQCACLGAVFNLPMSLITLFEDLLLVAMSGAMLLGYWAETFPRSMQHFQSVRGTSLAKGLL